MFDSNRASQGNRTNSKALCYYLKSIRDASQASPLPVVIMAHKLLVLGAEPSSHSFSLAASLAAVYGLLASRRTLLADLSLGADQNLGLTSTRGVEVLLGRFLASERLEPDDLPGAVAPYGVAFGHPLWDRHFDLLVGPGAIPADYADNLGAQRGEAFVRALHEQVLLLGYEVVIVDFGQSLDTLRAAALANIADYVVVVGRHDDAATQAFIQTRLQPPHFNPQPERVLLAEAGEFSFPHPEFLDSLIRHEKRFEVAAARTALGLAERLHPGISKRLIDGAGRPIRPAEPGLLRRLFG